MYENLSLSKIASGDPQRAELGISEILSGRNRDSKQMLFRFLVGNQVEENVLVPFRRVLLQRILIATVSQRDLLSPHLKSDNEEIDLLVAAAKRRCSMIFRIHFVFCIFVILVMFGTVVAAVYSVLVLRQTTWALALGGAGLGQFFLLIWKPLRMLQKANADTTRIQLSMQHYREAFTEINDIHDPEERARRKKLILKDFVASLTTY